MHACTHSHPHWTAYLPAPETTSPQHCSHPTTMTMNGWVSALTLTQAHGCSIALHYDIVCTGHLWSARPCSSASLQPCSSHACICRRRMNWQGWYIVLCMSTQTTWSSCSLLHVHHQLWCTPTCTSRHTVPPSVLCIWTGPSCISPHLYLAALQQHPPFAGLSRLLFNLH